MIKTMTHYTSYFTEHIGTENTKVISEQLDEQMTLDQPHFSNSRLEGVQLRCVADGSCEHIPGDRTRVQRRRLLEICIESFKAIPIEANHNIYSTLD